jgi:hypothetical protein
MKEIDVEYNKIKQDPDFLAELAELRKRFIGRPSPIYECKNLSDKIGGARIYLKREDLNYTGSYKKIIVWERLCWRNGWARRNLLPRREPDNMALLWPRQLV